MAVEHPGDLLVLEGFVGHDVAPVTGGVADGEEDRLVLGSGPGEGGLAPGIPVHGIFRVLEKVGAFFEDQAVEILAAVRGKACGVDPGKTGDKVLVVFTFHGEVPSDLEGLPIRRR